MVFQPLRKFSGEGGLTATLQTSEHDDRRWVLGERNLAGFATENCDQLVVHNLNHLLSRVQGLADFVTKGAVTNRIYKVFDNFESNVSLEQGSTNLAKRGIDIGGS